MSSFITNEILTVWSELMTNRFSFEGIEVIREYGYIDQALPFKALNMGKYKDEYFLDSFGYKLDNKYLIKNLHELFIKDFKTIQDLSIKDKQAKKATSRADLYLTNYKIEIVIELEVFKDKPFSNLIFIPEACGNKARIPLYFIHIFAPERTDTEAELTRQIGIWLEKNSEIHNFKYVPMFLPFPLGKIKYLLPKKQSQKPKSFNSPEDKQILVDFSVKYFQETILKILESIFSQK